MKRFLIYSLFFVSILTAVVMLLTFNYWDGQSLEAWSVESCDVIFEGRITDYYQDVYNNRRGAIHVDESGSPFMYIASSIWSLPIWLTHYFNGNYDVSSLSCVYWYKILLLVSTGVLAFIVYKIINAYTAHKEYSMLGACLIMSSPEIMLSTMYAGQDEIIYITYFVIALYSFFKGNNKWFMFWATLSVTSCPIMLIPFIIITLLHEKRLMIIVSSVIITLGPTLIWSLISINAPAKKFAYSSSGTIGSMMDVIGIPTTTGICSLAGVLLVLLAFKAYSSKEYDFRDTLMYTSISMVIISFLMDNFFYRLMLYLPFVVLLILCKKENNNANININVFLLAVLAYIRMFVGGYQSPQNMNTAYIARSNLLLNVCNSINPSGQGYLNGSYRYVVGKLIENVPSLDGLISSFNAVSIGSIIIILLLNIKGNTKGYSFNVPALFSVVAITICMPIFMAVFYMILLA